MIVYRHVSRPRHAQVAIPGDCPLIRNLYDRILETSILISIHLDSPSKYIGMAIFIWDWR